MIILFTHDSEMLMRQAIFHGNMTMLAMLVERGVDLNKLDKHGSLPLVQAMFCAKQEAALFLIEKGAQINKVDGNFITALRVAIFSNDRTMVQLLLEKGADPNQMDPNNNVPLLHLCAKKSRNDIAILLLKYGADVNKTESEFGSPLCKAIRWGNQELVSVFVENGAKIITSGTNRQRPIPLAYRLGRYNVLRLLCLRVKKRNKYKLFVACVALKSLDLPVLLVLDILCQLFPNQRNAMLAKHWNLARKVKQA